MSKKYIPLGGFNPVEANLPIDARLVLTLQEMLSVGKTAANPTYAKLVDGTVLNLPDHYICLCSDNNELYVFDKANTYIPISDSYRAVGRFRQIYATAAELDEAVKVAKDYSDASIIKTLETIDYKYGKLSERLATLETGAYSSVPAEPDSEDTFSTEGYESVYDRLNKLTLVNAEQTDLILQLSWTVKTLYEVIKKLTKNLSNLSAQVTDFIGRVPEDILLPEDDIVPAVGGFELEMPAYDLPGFILELGQELTINNGG